MRQNAHTHSSFNREMLKMKDSTAMLPSWQWLHQHGVSALSLLLLLPLLLALASQRRRRGPSAVGRRRLPPSPATLPFIGNLHQLGSRPHHSLAALSQKHGPLMLLHLGQAPTVVVSSADAVEEMMKTHGVALESRPQLEAPTQFFYRCKDMVFSPYGEYWRNLRKICTLHLLGTMSVQSQGRAREEEAALMMEKIEQIASTSGVVDLRGILHDFVTGLVSRVVRGQGRCSRDEGIMNMVLGNLMAELSSLFARFHAGDYFPSLRWLSILTGLDSSMRRTFRKWDHVLDSIIESRLHRSAENSCEPRQADFVDILLALQTEPSTESPLTMESIKALLIDMLVAGTDTTYITAEWAMAELIRNPEAMQRAQTEVREIAGAKPAVEHTDTAQMSYLRGVIKETLRLHPPLPLPLPRLSSEDVQIRGYDVPKQTRVLINAWAIMRDPSLWEAPEEFRPERFLGDAAVDFRGSDFQYLPFGVGRRVCPGTQFAVAAVEIVLANLLHGFDWELPHAGPAQSLDMEEEIGIIVRKQRRLHLVPVRRLRTAS